MRAPGSSRRYRPTRFAALHHLWNIGQVIAGAVLIFGFKFRPLAIAGGSFCCLAGVWGFLSTRHVLNTWIITSKDQIVTVHPKWHLAIRWDQITDVIIRERPAGIMPGRADRMVLLEGLADHRVPLNTSVLSMEDEEDLLSEIRSRVGCPVQTRVEGLWPGGGRVAPR